MVKQLATKAEFDAELAAAGGTLVVVDFTATWCGPCKMISPVLEQMAKEHSDIIVVKVDVVRAARGGRGGLSRSPCAAERPQV
mmetsp:Transcript_14069/g.37856  ORF Transcript_14069/g.37856 Transcript_14069/m.37856 type:complete len:83 (-) Transcript_14069:668-916(-)